MPKEKINTLHRATTTTLLGESAVLTCSNEPDTESVLADRGVPIGQKVYDGPVVVQVGWQKDVWVQLSIEADVSYFRFAAEYPDGDGSTSTADKRSTVYTAPLDRDEINKLIRTLRRAREQVFGRDE